MDWRLRVITCFLITCSQDAASALVWHVSNTGVDSATCGQIVTSPCQTLTHVLSLTSHDDVIQLYGDGTFYEECSGHVINTSVTIRSVGQHQAVIGCPPERDLTHGDINHIFILSGRHSSFDLTSTKVAFENVTLSNGYVLVQDCDVSATYIKLYNAAFRSHPTCDRVGFALMKSRVEISVKKELDPADIYDTSFWCKNLKADVKHSEISDVNLNFIADQSNHVSIENSSFNKKLQLETGLGGVNISLPYRNGSVNVINSIMENIIHYNPVKSSINIESSTLRIESDNMYENISDGAIIFIYNTTFRNNERAVSISRAFQNISIVACRFIENAVMHAAAGVRIALADGNPVFIQDTLFESNAAGYNRHESVPGKFEYDGYQIRISERMVNGLISLVGKGGAVRIHRGHVVFNQCTFRNNSATLLGGAIYLAKNGTMELVDSHFENSVTGAQSMQGDVLYSSGQVSIVNSTFAILSAMDHVSILRHSGIPWSMSVRSLLFTCPIGNRLIMVNNTSHRVQPNVGLMRSNKLDQLYYYCQTCGNNQYSIDQGYINYTLTSDSDEFFTLLINGDQPFESHPVSYEYGNITCHECPYGADCEGDIKAVANFWGYVSGDLITFQHCPPEYCCSSTLCQGIDTCAAFRHGRLCGRCAQNFSEALFSENCVQNNRCKNDWIWAVFAVMGLIYIAFLIVQKDIRDIVSSWGDSFNCEERIFKARRAIVFTKMKCKSPDVGTELPSVNGTQVATEYTCNNDGTNGNHVKEEENEDDSKSTRPSGTLIILFYYFQDSLLLHIDTVYTKIISKFVKRLKIFLVGLFRFRLDVFQFMDDICITPDLQPVKKLFIKTLFVPYVLVLLGTVFILYKISRCFYRLCCKLSTKRKSNHAVNDNNIPISQDSSEIGASFSCRLASGFTLAVLFTYQKMATATFALLNCVPVGNASVLFIDGSKECFEWWQYVVMVYAFSCVVPFCLVLMLAPPLLRSKTITVCDFCVGCIVPFPTVAYWMYKHIKCGRSSSANTGLSVEAETIISVLQGPFKESESRTLVGQLCWAGVLVGRRLILFLCYTFINDVLVRLLCMLCICFVILMHHMYIKPYKAKSGNLAGAFSAAALLVVGTINLLRACFEAAEYIPEGPYKYLMEVCEEIENTLVLWLPLGGVCIIILAFFIKLTSMLLGMCQRKPTQNRTDHHPSTEMLT